VAPRTKPKPAQAAPGSLGDLDFLDDVAKPAKLAVKVNGTDDLENDSSDPADSAKSEQILSAKRQPARASKHHVSLYVSPQVDREMKRIALDEELKTWEVYHEALRQYLDRKGRSFDNLMREG